jgi:hypothetical protein
MWWHSTIVEAYAWNAILTVAAIALLQRLREHHSDRALAAFFFVAGLSFFNHVQMGILVAGAAAYLAGHLLVGRRVGGADRPARLIWGCALAFLVGFAPYATTFAVDVTRFGGVGPALGEALGGGFRSLMAKGSPGEALADVLYLGVLQFPSPFLPAVGAGAWLLWRDWRDSPALLGLVTTFAVNTAFFAFYNTWDKFAFLLPSFVVLAYAGSFAVEKTVAWARWRRSLPVWLALGALAVGTVLTPPLVYARLVEWSRWGGPLARYAGSGNPIDSGTYKANPDKSRNTEYEDYVRLLFARLPPRAIYVDDDGNAFYPVRYFQEYRGLRRDVRAELVNSWRAFRPGLRRARVRPNGEPFVVEFVWTPPDGGEPTRSEPLFLPFGCQRAWAQLDRKGSLVPGAWRVRAVAGGRALAEVSFVIRAPAPGALPAR